MTKDYLSETLHCPLCKKIIRNAEICVDYCTLMMFGGDIKAPYLLTYDYDQIINNVRYRVRGNQDRDETTLYKSTSLKECLCSNDNRVLSLSFQTFTNQQELESLLPRLLKLKAFI